MKKPFSIILQYLIPQKLLTYIAGKLANSSFWGLHKFLIPWYIKHYRVEMKDALDENILHYKTFNQFFTRRLKPSVRTIDMNEHSIISPADGWISQMGNIVDHQLLQAKGVHYQLNHLLAGQEHLSQLFQEGKFATIYLSPRDYHRVHMPLRGTLKELYYVPGKLFSVNLLTAEHVPGVFARNERAIFIFDTAAGPMALIMVGAMIVAGIHTVCQGKLSRSRHIQHFTYEETSQIFEKGQELAQFELGSTVILLFQHHAFHFSDHMQPNQSVQWGNVLGEISS
jgi:phosphatidylserine decarboxylase